MEMPDLGVPIAVAAAGLFVVCSVLWLLDRRWAATTGSLAAVGITMVVIASERGASGIDLALADVAWPLIVPLLAASVMPTLTWSAVLVGCAVLSGPVHALLYDPFLDPSCESGCDQGRFTVRHLPGLASSVAHVGAWGAAVVVSLAVLVGPRRRPVLLVAAVASWWQLNRHDLRVLLVVAVAVVLTLGRDMSTAILATLRLRELAAALDNSDDLEGSLRSVTLDPELTIEYLVDGTVAHSSGSTARANETLVRRGGRPLAVIRSESSEVDVDALAAELNGPARLAFEVERLRAMSTVKSQHLDASRSRIVASGDEARRRLERDIHDGAQQQVLSLGMQLELALLDVGDDEAQRHVLELCLDRVGGTLNELRGLAHSLRPFPLEVGGLDAALHAVAARARVPVSIGSVVAERLDAQVEQTVIALVQTAVTVAHGPVDVNVVRDDAAVRIRISGVDVSAMCSASSDRIAAAGGRVETGKDQVEVWVPCGS
jgi:signal transduction histidine kinase